MSENIIVQLTSIETENIIIILFVATETALEKSDSVNYIECGHEIISLCGIRGNIIKFLCSVIRCFSHLLLLKMRFARCPKWCAEFVSSSNSKQEGLKMN